MADYFIATSALFWKNPVCCFQAWRLDEDTGYNAVVLLTARAAWIRVFKGIPSFCRKQAWSCVCRITEPNNSWDWKEPPEVIRSNHPAYAGPPRNDCPAPCLAGFWICPGMETPKTPWETFARACSPPQQKKCFLMFRRHLLWFNFCPFSLVLPHWAPLKSAWIRPLCILHSGIYIH